MDAPSPKVVAGRWMVILVCWDASDGLGSDISIDRIEIDETIVNPTINVFLLKVRIAHLAVGVYPSVLLTFVRTRSSEQFEVTVEVTEKRLLGPKAVA